MAKVKKEEQESFKDKRVVYVGKSIKTPYIIINRFSVLLDYPKNYNEISEKAPEIKELFIPIVELEGKIKTIKNSEYIKKLSNEVERKLRGGN